VIEGEGTQQIPLHDQGDGPDNERHGSAEQHPERKDLLAAKLGRVQHLAPQEPHPVLPRALVRLQEASQVLPAPPRRLSWHLPEPAQRCNELADPDHPVTILQTLAQGSMGEHRQRKDAPVPGGVCGHQHLAGVHHLLLRRATGEQPLPAVQQPCPAVSPPGDHAGDRLRLDHGDPPAEEDDVIELGTAAVRRGQKHVMHGRQLVPPEQPPDLPLGSPATSGGFQHPHQADHDCHDHKDRKTKPKRSKDDEPGQASYANTPEHHEAPDPIQQPVVGEHGHRLFRGGNRLS